MQLRPYQQDAANAALDWIKKCLDPCLIEAPTGSGKTHIIAALAHEIKRISGKKVLVLAPTGTLVDQNYTKYLLTGEPASIYSASLGKKTMHHDVVFGSPLTVANNLQRFGEQFAAIVIDEADGLTPTLLRIIDHVKSKNPKLRVIGLTATPFRLNDGLIYANHYEHGKIDESQAINPFFHTLVYSIDARMLIDEGYLTPPVFEVSDNHYDTSGLVMTRTGKWESATVDMAFVGHGRKTASIVADIVEKSRNREGVMIFGATIKHAKEIAASLPPELTRIITGENNKNENSKHFQDFKDKKYKYLVNVNMATVGFDCPHADVVAILRKTESARLLQQIIGRILRIHEGKYDGLILDYAENIAYHFPDGDVFNPEIKARKKGTSEPIEAVCELCGNVNEFSARPNPEGYPMDKAGYFIDLAGNRIKAANGMDLPAHFGRRCMGEALIAGTHSRCTYKWSVKTCPECEHDNDIAARYCSVCKFELVDPNANLVLLAEKMQKNPYSVKIEECTDLQIREWKKSIDDPGSLRIDFYVGDKSISKWYKPSIAGTRARTEWKKMCIGIFGEYLNDVKSAVEKSDNAFIPVKIAYRKNRETKYYEISAIEYAIQ